MKARLLTLVALTLGAAGCLDPIVGARCVDGYVPCRGRCVVVCTPPDGGDPRTDGGAGADGSDGRTSDDSGAHTDGGQDPSSDGGTRSGDALATDGRTGGPAGDGFGGGGPFGDGSATGSGDAGGSGEAGNGKDAGTATDALGATTDAISSDGATAPDAPGAGATDASAGDGASSGDGAAIDAAGDALAPDAGPPADLAPPIDCGLLTYCPIGCVDLTSDPDNCGSCNFSCGTGLCVSGTCQIRQAGHLVVIGHDYAVSRPSMDNLVGNAVFLAAGANVRVLAYHGDATTAEINGTDSAIQRIAASSGRTWIKLPTSATDVPAKLASADVFVIYAQAGASDASLLALGTNWATALSDFLQAGKTIVLLEGFYANAGTYQIVQQANLFHATGRMEVTGQTMQVTHPGDAIATRVPQTYRGERSTVWFATMDQTVVVQVVTDAGTEPVVIHLVF